MIERYALSPMKEIWTLKAQYERWLKVELAVIDVFEERGTAPPGTHQAADRKAKIDVDNILEIEEEVRHDVIAFIKSVTRSMGDEARFFHMGLTSSDVVDTALSLGMKQSMDLILDKLEQYIQVLKKGAQRYRKTITLGRTHGIHAEPTVFGLKWLSYLSEAQRNRDRLKKTLEAVSTGKISGAVGNYANVDPQIEQAALNKIGLKACKCSTQVVPRDIHAEMLSSLALLGAGIERIALEIRHLQRSEVQEAMEPFRKGQRGSSAMPHKKNPIITERLCGLSRLLRSNADASYENIALWHERDISHSSVERVIIPDSLMVTYYMLEKIVKVLDSLVVNEEEMRDQFKRSYNLVYSQRLMLALINKGMSREEAYKLVQQAALVCWKEKTDFIQKVRKHEKIREFLSDEDLQDVFKPDDYLRNVGAIYGRFDLNDEEQ